MRSQPRSGLPNKLAHAATSSVMIHEPPSAKSPGRQQLLNAHMLEVFLRILFSVVVRQSITGVAFERDSLEVNFSRTHLLLEPELFHLQVLHSLASTARQDSDRRRITPLILISMSSPSSLQNCEITKNFATHFQRCTQFSLSARQSDTRLSSRQVKQRVRSMQTHWWISG